MNNGETMLFNIRKEGSSAPTEKISDGTTLLEIKKNKSDDRKEIINSVLKALKEKGYSPVSQFGEYLISGDPTYITSYNDARKKISSLEKDEIVEELIKAYIKLNDVDI